MFIFCALHLSLFCVYKGLFSYLLARKQIYPGGWSSSLWACTLSQNPASAQRYRRQTGATFHCGASPALVTRIVVLFTACVRRGMVTDV